jgi:hypothetical protein
MGSTFVALRARIYAATSQHNDDRTPEHNGDGTVGWQAANQAGGHALCRNMSNVPCTRSEGLFISMPSVTETSSSALGKQGEVTNFVASNWRLAMHVLSKILQNLRI